jgi:hypothetical protein
METDKGATEEDHDETALQEEQLKVVREKCYILEREIDNLIPEFQHFGSESDATEAVAAMIR